jgi:hypothetical protein
LLCGAALQKCARLTELLADESISKAVRKSASICIREKPMGGLIYLIGLIVVVMFILSFLGLR